MKYLKIITVICFSLIIIGQAQVWKSYTPPALNVTKIIIDSVNQRAVLYGGGLGGNTWYDGVWEMSLADTLHYSWVKMQVTGPIQKRGYHCFIYDPKLQRGIVFCGDTSPTPDDYPCYTSDVRALNLQLGSESWQKLNPSGTPPLPRVCAEGIYHPTRNSMIFFGGINPDGARFNDVWELKLDTLRWQQINPPGTKPAPREAFPVCYDQINNRMIVFGGFGDNGAFYNDLWALDLTKGNEHWIHLSPTGMIPTIRAASAYGFDTKRNKLYIFGGWNYYSGFTFYNDVYVLDIPTMSWNKINPTGDVPVVRRNSAGAYDIFNDNFIIFGGDAYYGLLSDTYILFLESMLVGSQWVPIPTINSNPELIITSPSQENTRIRYILSRPENMQLDIIDVNGRVIKNLASGISTSPTGWLVWNRIDNNNNKVSAGIYFCRLQTDELTLSKKFVIIK
jgi:hypothetical protein